jgi:hypothetical protein
MGEDGDGEVLHASMSNLVPPGGVAEEAMHLEDDLIFDDGLDEVPVLER